MRARIIPLIILMALLSGLLSTGSSLAQSGTSLTSPAGWIDDSAPEGAPDGAKDQPASEDWYRLPPSAFTAPQESIPAKGILQTASGLSHTCALTTQGGVKCWGNNVEGKLGNGSIVDSTTPVDVYGLSEGVASLSGTHKHTCALMNSGEVKCWGRNWHGELGDGTTEYRITPVTPQGLSSGVTAIAAGGFHTCALMADGSIRCWGANWHGEVGDGTDVERHSPVAVVELGGKAEAIAAGKYHTCAILDTGGLRCWGYNKYGQIGNGPEDDEWLPAKVAGLNANVAAVALGENHSCALLVEDRIVCWGNNEQGQLGIGNTETQYVPVFVTGMGVNAAAVITGQRFTCAFALTGGVYCWGENWAGQLGDGTQDNRLIPTAMSDASIDLWSLSAGDSHACGVLDSGGVACWGSNSHGQLGDGLSAVRTEPVEVDGLLAGYSTVVSGGSHSCALSANGGVLCWGDNQYGQLGDGTNSSRTSPAQVYGLSQGVLAITAGSRHTCAMTASQVLCWGYNAYGQVGSGNRLNYRTPVSVVGIYHPPTKIAAGSDHSCAIQDNGVVKCWGFNSNGQLGNGTRDDAIIATAVEGVDGIDFHTVDAGERHTCAISTAGETMCWGMNQDGQLGIGSIELSTIPVEVQGIEQRTMDVALGNNHTCAVLEDRNVLCWGDNLYGQLGDGTTYDVWLPVQTNGLGGGVLSLSAGGDQTCARLADSNAIQCWGDNQSGQLGDGTTFIRLNPVYIPELNTIAVGAGAQTTCAVTLEGPVKCWGTNARGQVGDGSLPWSLTPGLVKDLVAASLVTNYASGYPGSYFTIRGSNFDGNSNVVIKVNNLLIDSSIQSNTYGSLTFLLDASLAELGGYVVSVEAGDTRNVLLHVEMDAPLRSIEDDGPIYQIPANIALTWSVYLPWEVK